MATYSSAKLFVCFFSAVILFVEGAKTARVVYPRLLEERSSDGGMVVKVHDDLTLNLRKGSVAARQLRVLTEENGRTVTHFYNGEDIERNLYEDQEQASSVMVTKAGSGVRMEGLVSPIHRIQPIAVSARSEDGVVPHEIHEIEQKEMLDKTLTYRLKDTVPSERSWNSGSTNVPPSVTVEVFIVLDRWHHRHFNSTEHALWYLCVTVNAANLRYSDTSNPRIQLLLTGVEKAVTEEYVVSEKSGYLFDDGTLTMFRAHAVLRRTTYGRPDVVYLMTGRDVSTYHNGKISDAGLGIGFMSGVCTDFYVALGEDKPGLFSGMHTFSHEMAHLLGAKHDGDGPDLRFPGHPGALNCSWNLGHIMSYRNTGPAHHRFSTCSLAQMRLVISRAGPACWKVTAEGESVRNMYPGMVVSFKEFCSVLPSDKNFTYDHATVYQGTCRVRCYFYSLMVNPVFPEWGSYKVMYDYTADALDYMQCGDHHVSWWTGPKIFPYALVNDYPDHVTLTAALRHSSDDLVLVVTHEEKCGSTFALDSLPTASLDMLLSARYYVIVCIRAICQEYKGFPARTTTIADTSEPATVTETTTPDETTTTRRTARSTTRKFAWRHRSRRGYP